LRIRASRCRAARRRAAGARDDGGAAVATATTDAAGHYDLSVPDGVWCVSEEGRAPGTLCDVLAELKGGSWSSQIIRHAPGPAPKCVPTPELAKHAVRGTVTLATEPCGDAGLPPRPLPGKKLYLRDGDGPKARMVGDVTAGPMGASSWSCAGATTASCARRRAPGSRRPRSPGWTGTAARAT
jgi:hypothetical protein